MSNQNSNHLPRRVFPFIWHFLRDYKFVTAAFVFLAFSSGLWGPFNNILIKDLIDLLPQVQGSNISILALPSVLIVINFIVFDNITWRTIGLIYYRYEGEIKNKIIHKTLDHVLNESHQFFQDALTGRISSQVTLLADNVQLILGNISADLIRGVSLLLATFVASYLANPAFCYVLFIWFALFSSFSIWMSRRLVSLSDNLAKQESTLSGQVVDIIGNHSNVRLFSHKAFELLRLKRYFDLLLGAYRKKEGFVLVLLIGQGLMIAGMMGASVYLLSYLYQSRKVSIGDFALILGLSLQLGHMMWYTMFQVNDLFQAVGKCKQSLSFLMKHPEIQDIPNAKKLICNQGKIEFNNVGFHYKHATPLFQDKFVKILPGQKVGLVGYSGSGKSTFVNLILRLYDIKSGEILIDDQNIAHVTQDSLRHNIAMIPQDPSLFHRTIIENIRYGKKDATDNDVVEAAKKAHAHEFIIKLPDAYESLVGERGVKLSGGQRQRIAIARAILKNAPILILDEATSQLDSVTESLIQESLWNLMEGKTTLVIAHRLSTLLHMDRILVFDKGTIVEDGSHQELLDKGSLYKILWDAQVGGFLGDH